MVLHQKHLPQFIALTKSLRQNPEVITNGKKHLNLSLRVPVTHRVSSMVQSVPNTSKNRRNSNIMNQIRPKRNTIMMRMIIHLLSIVTLPFNTRRKRKSTTINHQMACSLLMNTIQIVINVAR